MGREDYFKEITNLAKKIKANAVILFGSRARGNNLKESDIDLLIVGKVFEDMNIFERIRMVNDLWAGKYSIEPVIFTPEEFDMKFSNYSPLALDPVSEGKAIVNKSFLKKYKEKLRKMISSGIIERYGSTWRIHSLW